MIKEFLVSYLLCCFQPISWKYGEILCQSIVATAATNLNFDTRSTFYTTLSLKNSIDYFSETPPRSFTDKRVPGQLLAFYLRSISWRYVEILCPPIAAISNKPSFWFQTHILRLFVTQSESINYFSKTPPRRFTDKRVLGQLFALLFLTYFF